MVQGVADLGPLTADVTSQSDDASLLARRPPGPIDLDV
jgi:hypothetical protein